MPYWKSPFVLCVGGFFCQRRSNAVYGLVGQPPRYASESPPQHISNGFRLGSGRMSHCGTSANCAGIPPQCATPTRSTSTVTRAAAPSGPASVSRRTCAGLAGLQPGPTLGGSGQLAGVGRAGAGPPYPAVLVPCFNCQTPNYDLFVFLLDHCRVQSFT